MVVLMQMTNGWHGRWTTVVPVLAVASSLALGQTRIEMPKNKYKPEQDVELGRQAAAEVRQQYPVIKDEAITAYLAKLGERLVAAAPSEWDHPAFEYSFTPVNVKEINAFALPGGPMFVNRGMFDAAATEGEVVGVMAHELAHVLLRHGTANATRAQNPWLQLGAIGGAVAGAVVGGAAGSAIAQGSQFGLGTLLLRYSRDFERQADLLGAQIMARAGYDPVDLARMFETITRESKGSAGPQWLSSHPDPGNRSAYITKEASQLTVATPGADTSEFGRIQTRFAGLPPARSMAEVERGGSGGGGRGREPVPTGTIGAPVPAPSSQYQVIRGGGVFQAAAPSNWRAFSTNRSIKVAPDNGFGQVRGQAVLTHGVEFGVAPAASRDLRQATSALLDGFARGNPDLRLAGQQQAVRLSGRTAIGTPLVNRSVTGQVERLGVYTTFLSDGSLFYYLTVAPEDDLSRLSSTFNRIGQSIRLTDR
jgi:hypothetical protein